MNEQHAVTLAGRFEVVDLIPVSVVRFLRSSRGARPGACPFEGPTRPRIEVFGDVEQAVFVIPLQDETAPAHHVEALAGVRAVADDVAEADAVGHPRDAMSACTAAKASMLA
jgi:hypothetical protein